MNKQSGSLFGEQGKRVLSPDLDGFREGGSLLGVTLGVDEPVVGSDSLTKCSWSHGGWTYELNRHTVRTLVGLMSTNFAMRQSNGSLVDWWVPPDKAFSWLLARLHELRSERLRKKREAVAQDDDIPSPEEVMERARAGVPGYSVTEGVKR